MNDRDDLLKSLTTTLTTTENEETNHLPAFEDTKVTDIDDLISNNNTRVLSNTDYLILTDIGSGRAIDAVAAEYEVTQNYIKKLMRSDVGTSFLKETSKRKSELALSLSTSMVYEGVIQYQKMIDELFRKGQAGLALNYLFGKQSLSEVQASLHKQHSGVVEEDNTALQDLFLNLMSKPEK